MRDRCLVRPAVGNRVVLPRRRLCRIDGAGVVTGSDVDLPVGRVVSGHREAADVRHRCAGRPRVGSHVVDASRVVVDSGHSILAAEHVQLVRRRVVDRHRHDRGRGSFGQRRPGVRCWVELVQLTHGQAGRERVTTEDVRVTRAGAHRSAVEVRGHRRPGLPARRRWRRRRWWRAAGRDVERPVAEVAEISAGVIDDVQLPSPVRGTAVEGGQVDVPARRRCRAWERIAGLVVSRHIAAGADDLIEVGQRLRRLIVERQGRSRSDRSSRPSPT